MCFNYLEMIDIKGCAFNNILGELNLEPVLGAKFTNIFPCFIILFFLFHYFDFYSSILVYFGLRAYSFNEDYDFRMIENGCLMI